MTARTVALVVGPVALTAAVGVLHAREQVATTSAGEGRILYVRSGESVARLALSFDSVAADLYWLRAIQHYGRDRVSSRTDGRFGLLEPLLGLVTALDPRFNVAYRFGAILLAEDPPDGPGRPDQAIAILEKGLAANPDRWQYAHDIAFVHYLHTRRYDEAARWFLRASGMPGSPGWLAPLAAVTLEQGGDRDGARRLLSQIAETSDGYVRRTAERRLAQLEVLDDLDRWHVRIQAAAARDGVLPRTLAAAGADGLPLADPAGHPYAYDPATGRVFLSTDSPLSPLPVGFERR